MTYETCISYFSRRFLCVLGAVFILMEFHNKYNSFYCLLTFTSQPLLLHKKVNFVQIILSHLNFAVGVSDHFHHSAAQLSQPIH